MALFSDIDWIIIVAVAVFLLFGRENAQVLRTLGRWYGRALRLKQELLGELTKSMDLPSMPGPTASIRGTLLGLEPSANRASGIPTAVRLPPTVLPSPAEPAAPWNGGYPVPTWSVTGTVGTPTSEMAR